LLTQTIVGTSDEPSQASENQIVCNENRLTVAALFNDRTAFAWVVVVFYFVGAAAALWAANSADSRERRFWLATGILLILLGLNKELDLQNLLTQSVRAAVRELGLYEQRRLMQGAFLLLLTVAGLVAAFVLGVWLRRSSKPAKAAAAGLVLLFAFVVMRAASFHHIDHWVTIDVAGLRSGWWLEIAGIAVIGISALTRGRTRLRQQSR
jgi:glucan phosphoethanolaminetransferase (alkaline phosphatase superfamily)